MDGFSKNALFLEIRRSKNVLHPIAEISDQDAFLVFSC